MSGIVSQALSDFRSPFGKARKDLPKTSDSETFPIKIDPAALRPQGRPRVHLMLDKSGSVNRTWGQAVTSIEWFTEQCRADPLIRDKILLAATEMSGRVESTGYMSVDDFKMPGITPGSTSPHCLLIEKALAADAEHARDLIPGSISLTCHVLLCDGQCSETDLEVSRVLADYRKAQEDKSNNLHVFVIEFGECNHAFTRAASVAHQAVYCNLEYQTIFADILNLIRAACTDIRIVERSVSLASLREFKGLSFTESD